MSGCAAVRDVDALILSTHGLPSPPPSLLAFAQCACALERVDGLRGQVPACAHETSSMCVLVQGAQGIILGSAAEGNQSLSFDHSFDRPRNPITMCAPGTKEWRARRVALSGLLVLATYAVAGLAAWHYLLAFCTQYEAQWQYGNVAPWTNPILTNT